MTEKPNCSNANKARQETKLQASMQLNTTAAVARQDTLKQQVYEALVKHAKQNYVYVNK